MSKPHTTFTLAPPVRDTDPLIDAKEVARQLGVSRWHVARLAHRGELRSMRTGALLRFRQSWIDVYIERQGR